MTIKNLSIVLAGFWIAPVFLLGQGPEKEFKGTARELFYQGAEEAPAPRPKPGNKGKRKKDRTGSEVPTPGGNAPTPARNRPDVIEATYSSRPLGLKGTILRKVDDQMVEVAPDAVFRAGDVIQVRIEVNHDGYLFVINQGSSGRWKAMFPSPEISEGSNRVLKGQTYIMPQGYQFRFDQQSGTEKLFIVFSRQDEPDLEKLLDSLRKGQDGNTSQELLVAQNIGPINDQVQRFREAHQRDLILEKIDDQEVPPGRKKETTLYVVDKSGRGPVQHEFQLAHQ